MNADSPVTYSAAGWVLAFIFSVTTGVLLLNMLIAMMAKTFDDVWAGSAINHQFLYARQLLTTSKREPEPPPLNVLRWPIYLVYFLLKICRHALPKGRVRHACEQAHAFIMAGFEVSSWATSTSDQRRDNLDGAGEYIGTTFEVREGRPNGTIAPNANAEYPISIPAE
jgi:hypothetical protein